MKLLMISSSAPFGKGESFVVAETNAIAEKGNDVLLVPTQIRRGSPNRFSLNENVSLLAQASFSFVVIGAFIKYVLCHPKGFFKLLKLVGDRQLKNCMKNYLVLPKGIWLANKLLKQPVDHIHAHWLTTSATLALLVGRLTGIPWSVTAHRGDIVANNLLNKKFEQAKFVRFISCSGLDLAKERAELNERKAHVLHIGVNIPQLLTSTEQQSDSSELVEIVCPANLIPVKGHDFLLQAVSQLRHKNKIKLNLAGDGELKSSLQQTVKELGIDEQVCFKGHVPHSKLLEWYQSGNVSLVILPSQDLGDGLHEGIPVSLMEAMSFQIPVISTRTGGIPELLQDDSGKTFGGLVSPSDIAELADLIDELVQSQDKRKQLGLLGYQRVISVFNQQNSVAQLIDLIQTTNLQADMS